MPHVSDTSHFHSDPLFPEAPPGARVEVTGRVWFYEGEDAAGEIEQARAVFHPAGN